MEIPAVVRHRASAALPQAACVKSSRGSFSALQGWHRLYGSASVSISELLEASWRSSALTDLPRLRDIATIGGTLITVGLLVVILLRGTPGGEQSNSPTTLAPVVTPSGSSPQPTGGPSPLPGAVPSPSGNLTSTGLSASCSSGQGGDVEDDYPSAPSGGWGSVIPPFGTVPTLPKIPPSISPKIPTPPPIH
jgi:hypothetical protein